MKEDRFIKENSQTWSDLESTLKRLNSKGFNKFDGYELESFITHYNRVCGHLSYSRTYYGATATTEYLNRLVASAHSVIYLSKTSRLSRFKEFYLKEFPRLIYNYKSYILLSFLLFLLGTVVSFAFILASKDNAYAFLPQELVNSIGFEGNSSASWDGSVMSSFIFTNNIRVGFAAFALGITLGGGTVFILLYNGFILGGVGALAYHSDAVLKFWSLILPHGILELFAIFVCGAAGLLIGYSIIHPGVHTRKDAFILKGKAAVRLVCGTLPIFIVAGLIEGFFTPAPISDFLKLAFAFLTLGALAIYIALPNLKSRQ